MRRIIIVLPLVLCFITTELLAQKQDQPIIAKLLIEAGVEYGGDEILQVFFTNGEKQTMRAGQGGTFAVGGSFQFRNLKQLMLRSSIGIKFNTTAADNANIRLTRIPIHFTPFWKINDEFRFGIGVTNHLNPKLKGDGFLPDVAFKSTVGPRFEFGYKAIALTYTAIKYKEESGDAVSASSFGVSASFTFPSKSKK